MDLRELLGITLPIIQAPMAGAQGSALAIAVSGAGALGSLPCAMLSVDAMQKEIAAIRAQTDKPYNLNFFCHAQPEPDAGRELRWRELLAPYYAEFGIDPSGIAAGPGRMPFNAEAADLLDAVRPPVISFHFGLPPEPLLDRARACGAKILSSATTVEEALWLEARGVDAIIAQGLEAGGHRGMFLSEDPSTQMGTFALLRQVVQEVRVPVIAAGGIADARGVAAAMAMGAAGVQIGTAYLLCPEATISAPYRAALASPGARHTVLTNIFSGRPARGIVNRAIREIGPMNPQAPAFPLATTAIAPLRAKAEAAGSGDFSPLWSGQNASGCKAIPASELTRLLAAGLTAAI
jgi:nitronate monooxygenase